MHNGVKIRTMGSSLDDDLRDYEQAKFALAEILRAISAHPAMRADAARPLLGDLFTRLAEDRFNLVVVGRYNRGKSSLMNAILATNRLPVGIVPLTSVITTVSYGTTERLLLHYRWRRIPTEANVDELASYVTQDGNPDNVSNIITADLRLPAPMLRRGFHFVDTPGLGSPNADNTRTTEEFLPAADAFLLVSSYESPLSTEELRVLRFAARSTRQIFIALNKQDAVLPQEREQLQRYVHEQLADLIGADNVRIYSVSARDAILARGLKNESAFRQSGVNALERDLVRFLINDKQTEFLLRFCDRVETVLQRLPAGSRLDEVRKRFEALRKSIGAPPSSFEACNRKWTDFDDNAKARLRFRSCEVNCELCRVTKEAEVKAVAAIVEQIASNRAAALECASAICFHHLELLLSSMDDPQTVRDILQHQSILTSRVADNMRRYATKHGGLRRHLASEEEAMSADHGLAVLVGRRHVNFLLPRNAVVTSPHSKAPTSGAAEQ